MEAGMISRISSVVSEHRELTVFAAAVVLIVGFVSPSLAAMWPVPPELALSGGYALGFSTGSFTTLIVVRYFLTVKQTGSFETNNEEAQ